MAPGITRTTRSDDPGYPRRPADDPIAGGFGPSSSPARLLGLLVMVAAEILADGWGCRDAKAQAKPDAQAAGVFDDEPAKKDEKKSADPSRAPAVTDRDSISFTQENVAAQMSELEERLFRLSEALRSLEPENASRLRLALKFSREELILQQMKEAQKLLREAQLNKAETEARELLAKLEHLRSVLLAEDLDFQMKLARLRQMRETLGQLERIIKEERRELAWSKSADEQQAEFKQLDEARKPLESLLGDQKQMIADLQAEKTKGAGKLTKESRDKLVERVAGLRKGTAALSANSALASQNPAFLKQADPQLSDIEAQLAAADIDSAIGAGERAAGLLRKELDRIVERGESLKKGVAPSEFQRFEQDQVRNRDAAASLAAASARLGNSGVPLQKDLIRAGGSMREAEQELEKTAAKPAATDQAEALKHLSKAHGELAKSLESLLVELRTELLTRLLSELAEMHEIQVSIRETTESQASRAAQQSRTALIILAGMSQKEAELADRMEHLRALTIETEFGIALPTSLHVIAREMTKVQGRLKEGDATAKTVAMEKRIEEDLLGLIEAMRRLPPTTPPPPNAPLPSDLRALERELNRLIAELKMIRLIQSRVNDDTKNTDGGRPRADASLSPELKGEIEALKVVQEELRDSLGKIAARMPSPPEDDAISQILKLPELTDIPGIPKAKGTPAK
ncbi:MAG: hypothetical protein ABS79_01930 [Planctomycetes bacterium SCN 63-9]|nr:MAG: hypothetical protein ABS79_01930 [Planctomycetes bacterium SCN 63-9]